jgi:hypothetical protein
LADGSTKPIATIEVGDVVLATDPETGETSAETVTATWAHNDVLVDLSVDGMALTTTEDHVFWNATDERWQEIQAFDPGDRLLTPTGETVAVTGLSWATTRPAPAYNLTIEHRHTYYVVVESTPVLVHNDDGGVDVLFGQRRIGPDFSEDGAFKGRSIYAVAEDLRAGRLSPHGIRIDAFWHGNQLVAVNNRSLAALSLAKMRPTNVNIVDPPSSIRKRLREPAIVSDRLPSRSVAVTPSQRDLRVGDIISTPGGC